MIQGMQVIETMPSPSPCLREWLDELDRAREVQARMLRRTAPPFRTLRVAGCYLPARVVGGDYCDFLELGPGRAGIALGDISGKGVSAALMMANLQALLRSRCEAGLDGLSGLLRGVNRLFCQSTGFSSFASLFLGEYEDVTGRLRYVNCGHPPALLLRSGGGAEWLAATATPLGILEDWQAAERVVTIRSRDTLLLYSDGLTESWNEREGEFGRARLLEAAMSLRGQGVREVVDSIVTAACAFGTGAPRDDVTLLVARRHEECPEAGSRPVGRAMR